MRYLATTLVTLALAAPAAAQSRKADPKDVYSVPTGPVVEGPADALVTMVLICQNGGTFCKRHETTVRGLQAKYGKDLRVARRPMVIITNRLRDATLGVCAAGLQGKAKHMIDQVHAVVAGGGTMDVHFMAKRLGLDRAKFARDKDGQCVKELDRTKKEMKELGVRGTPTTFINGRVINGAMPPIKFETLIDSQLALARKRAKSQRAKRDYYQKWVLKRGKRQAPVNANRKIPNPPNGLKAPGRGTVGTSRLPVPIVGYSYEGPRHAKVTMVVLCQMWGPYCKRNWANLRDLRKEFPRDLKIVHVPINIHSTNLQASAAACVAGIQGRFVQFANKMWAAYDQRGTANIKSIANSAGMNTARWDQRLDRCKKIMLKNAEKFRPLQGRGTPTNYINGIKVGGAMPIDRFRKVINAELKLANEALRRGTRLRDYYKQTVLERPAGPAEAP